MLVRANRAVDIIGQRLLTSFRGSETTQLPDQTFWDVFADVAQEIFHGATNGNGLAPLLSSPGLT